MCSKSRSSHSMEGPQQMGPLHQLVGQPMFPCHEGGIGVPQSKLGNFGGGIKRTQRDQLDLAAGDWRGHRCRYGRVDANVLGPMNIRQFGHSHTVLPIHNASSSILTPREKKGKEEWGMGEKIPN